MKRPRKVWVTLKPHPWVSDRGECYVCGGRFVETDPDAPFAKQLEHCHRCGDHRGWAHRTCNLSLAVLEGTARSYDATIQALAPSQKRAWVKLAKAYLARHQCPNPVLDGLELGQKLHRPLKRKGKRT